MIDALVIGIALLTVRIPHIVSSAAFSGNILDSRILFEFSAYDILIYFLGKLYYVLTTYFSGATLGKKLFRLRVETADGQKLTFLNVLYRETIGKYLSGIILCIGYLMIAVDDEKRALHDRLCDTRVVYNFRPASAGLSSSAGLPAAAGKSPSASGASPAVSGGSAQSSGRFALFLTVRDDSLAQFLNGYARFRPALLDEMRKAGFTEIGVLRNGSQFVYLFDCAHMDYAYFYLSNNPVYHEWRDAVSQLADSTFQFYKLVNLMTDPAESVPS